MESQFNTCLTTGIRGSGGPLPPFRHGLEPQKDDKMVGMTPWGVFFLACKPPYIKKPLLCQQTHLVQYLFFIQALNLLLDIFDKKRAARAANLGLTAAQKRAIII